MRKKDLLIGGPIKERNERLAAFMEQSGYVVCRLCQSGDDLLRNVGRFDPQVIVVDYMIDAGAGLRMVKLLLEQYNKIVLLIGTQAQRNYAIQKFDNPFFYFIITPIQKPVLLSTLEISLRLYDHINQLRNRVRLMQEKMEERIVIEKAKGILMRKWNLNEEHAYAALRKQSMDEKTPMRDLAKRVIQTEEHAEPGESG